MKSDRIGQILLAILIGLIIYCITIIATAEPIPMTEIVKNPEYHQYEIVDKYYYVNTYGNYIWCIEIMSGGEMLQREISESEYNELEVGDYWKE